MEPIEEVFNLGDGLYHHPGKLIVYAGDDDKVSDAIQITESQGKLCIKTMSPDEVETAGNRPRELDLTLDLPEENGEHARLHVVQHKGQTFLYLNKNPTNISQEGSYRESELLNKWDSESSDGEPSEACNDTGIAYMSDGVHMACTFCNADNIHKTPSYDEEDPSRDEGLR